MKKVSKPHPLKTFNDNKALAIKKAGGAQTAFKKSLPKAQIGTEFGPVGMPDPSPYLNTMQKLRKGANEVIDWAPVMKNKNNFKPSSSVYKSLDARDKNKRTAMDSLPSVIKRALKNKKEEGGPAINKPVLKNWQVGDTTPSGRLVRPQDINMLNKGERLTSAANERSKIIATGTNKKKGGVIKAKKK